VIDVRLRILTCTCRWDLGDDLASVLRSASDEGDEDHRNGHAITDHLRRTLTREGAGALRRGGHRGRHQTARARGPGGRRPPRAVERGRGKGRIGRDLESGHRGRRPRYRAAKIDPPSASASPPMGPPDVKLGSGSRWPNLYRTLRSQTNCSPAIAAPLQARASGQEQARGLAPPYCPWTLHPAPRPDAADAEMRRRSSDVSRPTEVVAKNNWTGAMSSARYFGSAHPGGRNFDRRGPSPTTRPRPAQKHTAHFHPPSNPLTKRCPVTLHY